MNNLQYINLDLVDVCPLAISELVTCEELTPIDFKIALKALAVMRANNGLRLTPQELADQLGLSCSDVHESLERLSISGFIHKDRQNRHYLISQSFAIKSNHRLSETDKPIAKGLKRDAPTGCIHNLVSRGRTRVGHTD